MKKGICYILAILLVFGVAWLSEPIYAQDEITIVGEGSLSWVPDDGSIEAGWGGWVADDFTLYFQPSGGPVTGSAYIEFDFTPNDKNKEILYYDFQFNGYFEGGDGGEINGTVSQEVGWIIFPSRIIEDKEFSNATWHGFLYADGTGSGTIMTEEGKPTQVTWQITFEWVPAEEKPADPGSSEVAADVEISHEYIYTTYGINVWDSFGDDGYDRAVWSPQELTWLNDVLKELPPELMDRMAVNRIVRNTVDIDEDGNQIPNASGVYEPCDISVDPQCDGSSATIRIFDEAKSQYDFLNDPDGEKQFKATIVHEMVHAMQYHKDRHSTYVNEYSPLFLNYIDATRQITDMEDPGFNSWNGWNWDGSRWRYTNDSSNQPPTSYGLTDPFEDMAESVMMYVYDPERLKNSSYERYYFMRDEMFGGVEYEDGVQKKP